MKKAIFIIVAIICFVAPFTTWIPSVIQSIKFDKNCGNYLELAADANSIEIAEKQLTKAVEYLEKNNITNGHTSILIYYPKNDIGMWYDNLKAAQLQLKDMLEQGEITELEESNMLMKLRETILNDNGTLTHPKRISLYPNYALMFWLNCTLWLLWILGFAMCILAYEDSYIW